MEIQNLINENLIIMNLESNVKEDAFREIIEILAKNNKITSKDVFFETILSREEEGPTGLGRGIAIPHGKSEVVNELTLAFGRSKNGIEYNSLDQKPVNLFFMVADYKGFSPDYLKMVSKLVSKMRVDENRQALLDAKSKTEVLEIIYKLF
ncbi:PTS sugar transporter subunit IIA [Halanaerobium hydrogeniformans]|uniref:PTS IIA-like nitrogen-regulatory protein PtsN n=1 Tax=Halanaerobium hydrogeniformans TaxID=656519 RepID=E4RKV0_HALHG|nr:PTS sugar transporter subunit IIA [Halanaerobium hydrogeniformans]ADQ15691.1 putative PTS IIA-like nitrogen-regulatory protein PtsN [Halanaerobium hydrogeniformans]